MLLDQNPMSNLITDILSKFSSTFRYFIGSSVKHWRIAATDRGLTAIVCYHRLSETANSDDYEIESAVSIDVFAQHMAFLCKHFRPIPPSKAADLVPGELRCAVTFDDGYLDNFSLAAPILERFDIPAGFYLCSDYVGTDRTFWWERLAELIRRARCPSLDTLSLFPETVGSRVLASRYDLATRLQKEQACNALSSWMSPLPHSELNPILTKLADALGAATPETGRRYPLMDWSHAKELRRRGFEIGAHTANHVNLAGASQADLQRELCDSHHKLEQFTDGPIQSLAYPYGRGQHLSASAATMAEQIGYRCALTTVRGIANIESNRFLLPRLHLKPRWHFGCAYNTDQAIRSGNGAVQLEKPLKKS